MEVLARLPEGSPVRRVGRVALVAPVCALVGAGLAAVGAALGPLWVLLLPAAVAAAAGVLLRPWLAVPLVVLTLPVGLRPLPAVPLGLEVAQVVVLAVTAVAVTGRLLRGDVPLPVPRPLVWVSLLVPWAVFSTLSALSLDAALRQLTALTANTALALLVAATVATGLALRRLLLLLVGVAAATAAPALASADRLAASYGGGVVDGRLVGIFTQPNQFGTWTMVATLLGAGLLLAARTARERLVVAVLLLPVVAGLVLSLSRSAWLGVVAGAVVLLVLLPAARRMLLSLVLPLLVVAAALGAFAPESPQVRVVGDRVATLAEGTGSNPYDDRPRIWAEGRREVRLDPLTGLGPGSFPVASARTGSGAVTVQAEHAHDVLLTVAAEYGLPGAALLVALTVHVGLLVRPAVRRLGPRHAPLVAGCAAACAGIAAQGIVDYTMRNAVLFTVVFLVLGLTVAACRLPTGRPTGTG